MSSHKSLKIHKSKEYDKFSFIDLNRTVETKHVKLLREAIKRYGFLGVLVCVYTDLFEGVKKLYILDGQHRFNALKDLGYPIEYKVSDYDFNSKKEVTKLIAALNASSKPWTLEDYLHAWSTIGLENYIILKQKYELSGINISLLQSFYELKIDSGTLSRKFKNGNLKIPNISLSLELMQTFQAASSFIDFDHWTQERDFSRWIITNHPEKSKLLQVVTNKDLPLDSISQYLDKNYA